MDEQKQSPTPPVSIDRHYQVIKDAEDDIKNQLGESDHYLLLCGLGISYSPDDEADDLSKLPYNMEFGYLESLECAMDSESEEISQEDWDQQTRGAFSKTPLPIEYLDRLYTQVKTSLEENASISLHVEIKLVLYGSPLMGYSIGCLCGRRGRRRKKYCYYDKRKHKTKCYCSPKPC